ncbi:WD40 repeat-like protein [Gonapodya prolifera JEL478]|uniref:WD40 repeat-like protein n=1 Tax=Gonapodya prolifera (strain JEL478) TaxID=1344416 RepID=A0A139APT3_GONPJ|nr:WD40 repeat-like protein [Gonapodya prolifera JEL478]|eukprot:KXS18664.1 WD40 repeat-like protein [Gonapodya prolifera JEL478]
MRRAALASGSAIGAIRTTQAALFSHDSSLFFITAPGCIRVHSTQTSRLVRTLAPTPASEPAALQLHPSSRSLLYVAYADGNVRLWDYDKGAVVTELKLGFPVMHFRLDPLDPAACYVVVGKHTKPALAPAQQSASQSHLASRSRSQSPARQSPLPTSASAMDDDAASHPPTPRSTRAQTPLRISTTLAAAAASGTPNPRDSPAPSTPRGTERRAQLGTPGQDGKGAGSQSDGKSSSHTLPPPKPTTLILYHVHLPTLSLVRISKLARCSWLDIHRSGEWLVALDGRRLSVWRRDMSLAPSRPSTPSRHSSTSSSSSSGLTPSSTSTPAPAPPIVRVTHRAYDFPSRITCAAIHPRDGAVALGDDTGKIRLVYALVGGVHSAGGQGVRPVQSMIHWHAHAVGAVAFGGDGTYLLSGGLESVVVSWHLSTGHRSFVPRLGGPIHSVSICPDGRLHAVGLEGGTFKVLAAHSGQLRAAVEGPKTPGSTSKHLAAPNASKGLKGAITVDPRSGYLALPAPRGALQMWDVRGHRAAGEVEVVPGNWVSRTEETEAGEARVVVVDFDVLGSLMATADVREGGLMGKEFAKEIGVKVWKWEEERQRHALVTRIPNPHGQRVPTNLVFRPVRLATQSPFLLSVASGDRACRFFSPSSENDAWHPTWLPTWRDLASTCACWSSDGSVAGVAWKGGAITLWDPDARALVGVVGSETRRKMYSGVQFVDDDRALLAWDGSSVDCFDAASGAICWSWQPAKDGDAFPRLVGIVKDGKTVVVGYQGKRRAGFQWIEESRDLRLKGSVAVEEGCEAFALVKTNAGVIGDSQQGSLVYLDRHGTLRAVTHGKAVEALAERGDSEPSQRNTNALEVLFGTATGPALPRTKLDLSSTNPAKLQDPLVGMPAHLMPPITVIFEEMMAGIMAKASSVDENGRERPTEVSDTDKIALDDVSPDLPPGNPLKDRGTSKRLDDLVGLTEDFSFLDSLIRNEEYTKPTSQESVEHGTNDRSAPKKFVSGRANGAPSSKSSKPSKRHAHLAALFKANGHASTNGHVDGAGSWSNSSEDESDEDSDSDSLPVPSKSGPANGHANKR